MTSVAAQTGASPFARVRPVGVEAVRLEDRFWAPRRQRNRDITLPSQHRRCEETGRLDNFRRASGSVPGPFQGRYYNDSDVYKWMEACAFTLADGPHAPTEALLDGVIQDVAAAQGPDGYLNTYFTFDRVPERWSNLRDLHELYCAGHLMQAAVAHHRSTGRTDLLAVARRLADCICGVFCSADAGGRDGACGHPEIETALIELYRETGERRYLDQARRFLESRGHHLLGGSPYHQDHVPFRELEAVTGHAVRMLYLACGAADLSAETGDAGYRETLFRLWDNLVTRRVYLTGGVGARYDGESFGADYELPNRRAYAETCAAIGVVMWAHRMLLLTGDGRFADQMETTLYNAVLAGASLDGERYFYQCPLEDDGTHRRQPWFACACCPPNVARLLASLPGYFASVGGDGLWLHLYATGQTTAVLPGGAAVAVRQETDYPWQGDILLRVEPEVPAEFVLHLRVPGWCERPTLRINDSVWDAMVVEQGYLAIRRLWNPGDTVSLTLPMPVERIGCRVPWRRIAGAARCSAGRSCIVWRPPTAGGGTRGNWASPETPS